MTFPTQSYAAFAPHTPLKPYEFRRRSLGTHDVLIDIYYCGICHSDLHQVNNDWNGSQYPMVPGHEIVGLIQEIGTGVKKFKVGDRVGIGCLVDFCGSCENCHDHQQQFCDQKVFSYNSFDSKHNQITKGGYSSHIVCDEKSVLRIPENLSLAESAPLLCAGITTYSPLRHWKIKTGDKVAVIGLGGLGHMAVKLARAMGAEVTVLSQSPRKKEDALKLGAHHFVVSSHAEELAALTNKFHLIINTVSAPMDLNGPIQCLKRDGTMVLVGLPSKAAEVFAFGLVGGRKSLAGSLIGGIEETQEMLDFCGAHHITSDIELIKADEINDAFKKLEKGQVKYRFVIDMKTL